VLPLLSSSIAAASAEAYPPGIPASDILTWHSEQHVWKLQHRLYVPDSGTLRHDVMHMFHSLG
jgi:hypothetical protein